MYMTTSKAHLIAASKKVLALAAERRERMAKASAKQPKATKRKPSKVSAEVPNGGFHSELEPVGDLGVDSAAVMDLGLHIPPELVDAVEEAQLDVDPSFNPGFMIPQALQDSIMAVADPAALSGGAVRFDLVPFGPPQGTAPSEIVQAGAHWILCANGEPLARIALKDQEHNDRIAAHFISPDFARSVIEGLEKHGIEKTLAAVKAKPYVAVVDQHKKVTEAKQKLAASVETQLRAKTAEIQDKFVKNLGLVLEASASNFFVENELKDALIAGMTQTGIPEDVSSKIVDDAYFAKGAKTIAAILDKSSEWTNYTPEALKELTASIKAQGRARRPLPSSGAYNAAAANPNYDHAMAARMASAVVPVSNPNESSTVSASVRVGSPEQVPADDKAAFRARFGGFRSY